MSCCHVVGFRNSFGSTRVRALGPCFRNVGLRSSCIKREPCSCEVFMECQTSSCQVNFGTERPHVRVLMDQHVEVPAMACSCPPMFLLLGPPSRGMVWYDWIALIASECCSFQTIRRCKLAELATSCERLSPTDWPPAKLPSILSPVKHFPATPARFL